MTPPRSTADAAAPLPERLKALILEHEAAAADWRSEVPEDGAGHADLHDRTVATLREVAVAWWRMTPPRSTADADSRPVPRGSIITIYDCGAGEEGEPNHRDPCPMCGATVSGNDPVNGVCQIMAFIGRPIGDWITRGVK